MTSPILSVKNLRIEIITRSGLAPVIDDFSFSLSEGEAISFVGESGCGKSMTALGIMGLLPERVGRIAAACAVGRTTLHGAQELRYKESDRIRSIVLGLKGLGVSVQERADGYSIRGGEILPGEVNSHSDHRIAMAFAMVGLIVSGSIHIKDTVNVKTSFPGFVDLARSMGMRIREYSGDYGD